MVKYTTSSFRQTQYFYYYGHAPLIFLQMYGFIVCTEPSKGHEFIVGSEGYMCGGVCVCECGVSMCVHACECVDEGVYVYEGVGLSEDVCRYVCVCV